MRVGQTHAAPSCIRCWWEPSISGVLWATLPSQGQPATGTLRRLYSGHPWFDPVFTPTVAVLCLENEGRHLGTTRGQLGLTDDMRW